MGKGRLLIITFNSSSICREINSRGKETGERRGGEVTDRRESEERRRREEINTIAARLSNSAFCSLISARPPISTLTCL